MKQLKARKKKPELYISGDEDDDEDDLMDDNDDGEDEAARLNTQALRIAQNQTVSRLYQITFGQRSPRHAWTNVRQLGAKDSLPSEKKPGLTIQGEFYSS